MSERSFSLHPFPSDNPDPRLRISGNISRYADVFAIRYELGGCLGELAIAAPADKPARKGGLWEETCFEFFLAEKDASGYREFNLSPAGHWNVYRFEDYRREMREEAAFAVLPFRVERRAQSLVLALEVDLDGILRADRSVEAAVSAVIRRADGVATYWALAHCGPRADFHHRDSFILEL